jgi:hypothetical protein
MKKSSSNPAVIARRLMLAVNRATDPERGTVDLENLLADSFHEDVLGTLRLIKDVIPKEIFVKLAGLDGDKEETEATIMRRLEKVVSQWKKIKENEVVGTKRVIPANFPDSPDIIDVTPDAEVRTALGFDPGGHVTVPAAQSSPSRRKKNVRGKPGPGRKREPR